MAALFGGGLGFVVGLFVGSLGAEASDIASMNALFDVFFGMIGLVFGAVAGSLLGAALQVRARSRDPIQEPCGICTDLRSKAHQRVSKRGPPTGKASRLSAAASPSSGSRAPA